MTNYKGPGDTPKDRPVILIWHGKYPMRIKAKWNGFHFMDQDPDMAGMKCKNWDAWEEVDDA